MLTLRGMPSRTAFIWLLSATILSLLVVESCYTVSSLGATDCERPTLQSGTDSETPRSASSAGRGEGQVSRPESIEDLISEAHLDIEGEPRQKPEPAIAEALRQVGAQQPRLLPHRQVIAVEADRGLYIKTKNENRCGGTRAKPTPRERRQTLLQGAVEKHGREEPLRRSGAGPAFRRGSESISNESNQIPLTRLPTTPNSPAGAGMYFISKPRLLQGIPPIHPGGRHDYRPDVDHQHLHRQRHDMFQRLQHLKEGTTREDKEKTIGALEEWRDDMLSRVAKLEARVSKIVADANEQT